MKSLKLIFASAILIPLSACSVPASDKLDCILPNGDTVTIVNWYQFDVLAKVLQPISGHLSERTDEQHAKIYYKSNDGRFKSIVEVPNAGGMYDLRTAEQRRRACAGYHLKDGTVSFGRVILFSGETEFRKIDIPEHIYFPEDIRGYKPESQQEYRNNNWRFMSTAMIKTLNDLKLKTTTYDSIISIVKNQVVYESMLLKDDTAAKDNPKGTLFVGGAYRSTSLDNGTTWSEPVISTESLLFAVGQDVDNQPGVAKLGKFRPGPGR
jgi:hypothetical protein